MNEWRDARFWLALAQVILGAVAATWGNRPIGTFAAAMVSGLGALGLLRSGQRALDRRRAAKP